MFSCENNFFFPLDPHVSFANLRGPWIPKTGIKHSYTSRGREAKENGKLVFYVLSLASTASNMAKKERNQILMLTSFPCLSAAFIISAYLYVCTQ
jgi:hypothetical protein